MRVTLPDGQEVRGHLVERRQWQRGGWMYRVVLPVWANTAEETVEARELSAWLTPGEQVHPIDGVDYTRVPTHPLPPGPGAPDPDRWGWRVVRVPPRPGRPGGVIMHIWDCPRLPEGQPDMDVMEALEVMRNTPGAVLCKECGASVALGPLLDPS